MAEVKWERLSDKLPEVGKTYLTCTRRGTICTKKYTEKYAEPGSRYNGFGDMYTLFWAELPEPPREFIAERNEAEAHKIEAEIERLQKKVQALRGGE